MNKQKGLAPILIILLIALGIGGYLIYQKQTKPVAVPQQTSEPTPVSASNSKSTNSAETANWKTYDNSKLSISYPSSWLVDDSALDITFKSSDYLMSSQGFPQKGFSVILFVGKMPFTGNQGLVSITKTQWLGDDATLQVYKYEANDLVFTTKHNNITYQMVMTASSDVVRDANKEVFLKVANTLKIK